jgi:hypothetical protein
MRSAPSIASQPDVEAAAGDAHVEALAEHAATAEPMTEVAPTNAAAIAAVAVDRLNEALALLDRVRAAVPRASHQIEAAIQSAIAMLQTQSNDGLALDSTVSKLRLRVQAGALSHSLSSTLAANDHAARAYTSLDITVHRSRVPSSPPR